MSKTSSYFLTLFLKGNIILYISDNNYDGIILILYLFFYLILIMFPDGKVSPSADVYESTTLDDTILCFLFKKITRGKKTKWCFLGKLPRG